MLMYGSKLLTALSDVYMFNLKHFLRWPPRALILHEKKLCTKCDATGQNMEIALTWRSLQKPEQPGNATSAEKIHAVFARLPVKYSLEKSPLYIISISDN